MMTTSDFNPYGIFMRKIGYSVGLERTLERLSDLQELYASRKDVTAGSWESLVKKKWKLKSNNIADVFCSFRLIQETSDDLIVLENLDALTIACEMLSTEKEKQRAREFIFLWAVLSNDGEIFINLLLAKFEESKIEEIFSTMIEQKRKKLVETGAFFDKQSLGRIYRVVNIEKQKHRKKSKAGAEPINASVRTEPLDGYASVISERTKRGIVELSDDYFRKVPPRRKDWARSLGFWCDKNQLTPKGKKFIFQLQATKYIDKQMGLFLFWPMDYEFIRSGFPPERFKNTIPHAKGLWDCLVNFGDAFSDAPIRPKSEEKDPNVALELLEGIMDVFRSLHTRKSMLRRELPITVAYPAVIAIAVGRGEQAFGLPNALKIEQTRRQRRVVVRKSKHAGYAFWIRR